MDERQRQVMIESLRALQAHPGWVLMRESIEELQARLVAETMATADFSQVRHLQGQYTALSLVKGAPEDTLRQLEALAPTDEEEEALLPPVEGEEGEFPEFDGSEAHESDDLPPDLAALADDDLPE